MAPIIVSEHDPSWSLHFERIASHLQTYLATARVSYISIEHIGSTSIPNLAAKPNIDITIIVKDATTAEKARDALIWEPEPEEYYKCIGNGGIMGRISMKFQDYIQVPYRSVYIISEENADGMLGLRGYRDLKQVLTEGTPESEELVQEYGDVKWAMVQEGIEDGVEYGRRKNEIIRKILKRAGWTDEELEKKEALDVREVWDTWEL